MKHIKIFSRKIIILLFFSLSTIALLAQKPIKLMIVTGGHEFNRESFFNVFDNMHNIEWKEVTQPNANHMIEQGNVNNFDVLLFYDMFEEITKNQKKAYIDLLSHGKAMIFTHHAIVSYQKWDEFIEIIGGKYHEIDDGSGKKSNYEHNVDIDVKIINKKHPIVKGLNDFLIHDEIYRNCEILKKVKPILETNHPKSMKYLAWINPYKNSKVIYIQLGHDEHAFEDPNYRKLINQAIVWSAREHNNN